MSFQVNLSPSFALQRETPPLAKGTSAAEVFENAISKNAGSPPRPQKRRNENTPPRNGVKAVKHPADFRKVIEQDGQFAASRIANEHGTEILSDLLDLGDRALLNLFVECANDRTLHHAMLSVIMNRPVDAALMVELLDGRNWVQDSRDVATVLEMLIDNYTAAHREVAAACLNLFKDRNIAKSDTNYLFQKIAAPQDGMPYVTREFQMELVQWFFATNHFPTPFAWTQAVQKCAEQGRGKMVEVLWKATRGDALPSVHFNQEWRRLMIDHFKAGISVESSYINLLPFFFTYQLRVDSLGREDVEYQCKYKVFEENPAWLTALEVAISEKHLRTSYLLLSPHILGQITDSKTLLAGIQLLLAHRKYDLLSEFTPKQFYRINSRDLHELFLACREHLREREVVKMEQLIRNTIRQREMDEDAASRVPFQFTK